MKYLLLSLAGALTLLTLLVGCAGAADHTMDPAGSAAISVTVEWPKATTRLIPMASQSIRVRILVGSSEAKAVVIPRPPAGQATATVRIDGLPATTVTLAAAAYPTPDGTGTPQASGTTQSTLIAGSVVSTSLTMDSAIASVVLNPSTISLAPGESVAVTATAYDAQNRVVLTGPTTWSWAQSGSAFTLQPSGATCRVMSTGEGSGTLSATETESHKTAKRAVTVSSTVPYVSFKGDTVPLTPWLGQHVAFLTTDPTLDPAVMSRIASTFDGVYLFYQGMTGRQPAPAKTLGGRSTIAEVDTTCGAACGYLGATGIEIAPPYFDLLYTQVRDSDEWDQVLFYEFGRNFWFYGDKVEYKGADNTLVVTTGYAVLMRFEAIEALGLKPAPFHGSSIVPFADFKAAVEHLVDQYEADSSLNWDNTLRIGKGPTNDLGLGGTDLFASMCMRLERDHGGSAFLKRLWSAVNAQPNASTTHDALVNFVTAASTAAGTDLTSQFRDVWRWPI